MRHDRDRGARASGRSREVDPFVGRGEYGEDYEAPYAHEYDWGSGRGWSPTRPAGGRRRPRQTGQEPERREPFHGYGYGYGGSGRSRGSYQAGQLRSGSNPRDEFEFEWGGGYRGGRGYGGTNYDLQHGYRIGHAPIHGPARYGYGPYHERLQRRRRSEDAIREDVEDILFYDTWVDADRIEVDVEDGIVTLRGTLCSYDEVRYASDDAWEVDGVRGVRSQLRVEESRGREDERQRTLGRHPREEMSALDGMEESAADLGAIEASGGGEAAPDIGEWGAEPIEGSDEGTPPRGGRLEDR